MKAASLTRHDPPPTRVFEDQVRALPQAIASDNVAGETGYLLTVVAGDVADHRRCWPVWLPVAGMGW
jgi:Lrp/AsnC family transcriptional regulator, leucine-responsive regulatory protein